jgi:hypothetical protein
VSNEWSEEDEEPADVAVVGVATKTLPSGDDR